MSCPSAGSGIDLADVSIDMPMLAPECTIRPPFTSMSAIPLPTWWSYRPTRSHHKWDKDTMYRTPPSHWSHGCRQSRPSRASVGLDTCEECGIQYSFWGKSGLLRVSPAPMTVTYQPVHTHLEFHNKKAAPVILKRPF